MMKYFTLLIFAMCFIMCAWSQGAPPNEQQTQLDKIFENKSDVDFLLSRGGGKTTSIKYFLRNDTLWFGGTNLYTTVIPLNNVDFERKFYYLESSLYKNNTGGNCIEVPLYAIKGKTYEKEFEIEVFKTIEPETTTDFANLILPDKAFAEAFIKYVNERR